MIDLTVLILGTVLINIPLFGRGYKIYNYFAVIEDGGNSHYYIDPTFRVRDRILRKYNTTLRGNL